MPKTKPTLADIIPVIAVIAAAAVVFFAALPGEVGQYVEISCPGSETVRYPLKTSRRVEISSRGYELCVLIDGGEVLVEHSDCPGGVCVATGRISKVGQSIVCAPGGVVISVVGGDGNVDGIAG